MEEIKNATRVGLYIDTDLLARCDAAIPLTDARSRSEFVCDAIEHYIATLNVKGSSNVMLPFAWIKWSVAFPRGFPTRLSHEAFPQGCPTCHRGVSQFSA